MNVTDFLKLVRFEERESMPPPVYIPEPPSTPPVFTTEMISD